MLHRTDKQRIKQQYFCPADNQVVDRSDIVKGYEFRKGEYIVIEPEEIKKIEPKTAKTMEILEFVKSSEVELYAASDPIPAARESKVTFTGDTENAN